MSIKYIERSKNRISQLIWLNSNVTEMVGKIILFYIFNNKILSLFLT